MKFYTVILLLSATVYTSCNSHRNIVSSEAAYKHEVTKSYPLFFDAENARVLGDTKQAIALYTEYVKKYPENATALYNLARLQLQRMNINEAERNALKAFKLSPSNQHFQEFYTQLLVIAKKNKEAEHQYNDLISKFPRNEDYLYEKAVLQLMEQDYEKAILSFNALEAVIGFNEDIIVQKKNIYLQQGKTELAVREIEKLRQDDRSTPKYLIMIADIYSSAKMPERVKEVYHDIEISFSNDALAQVALAQYYSEQHDHEKYNVFMQRIMKNKNLDAETKMALLFPLLKKIETDTLYREEIIDMAKSLSNESNGNKEAMSLYADVLYFSGKRTEALAEYKKYLIRDSMKYSVWSQIIAIHSELQQTDSVISICKHCIGLFPSKSIPYFYAGVSYLQKREPNEAIHFLNKGLVFEKDNDLLQSQYYSSLGDAYNTLRNFELSDSCFDRAIQIQPNDATILNNYAYYLSVRKVRLEDAEKMSKKSLELQPNSQSFLDTYGWILFQQEKYDEALVYIKKAIDIDAQGDGTLLEHLGDVYFKLGHFEQAKDTWKKATEKGEKNPLLLKKIQDGKYYD